MKTVLEVVKAAHLHLEKKGIPESRRQAEELIGDALKTTRMQLYLEHDRPLNEAELATCRAYLTRRAKREPLQYITGEVEFFGCRIQVTPAVLIPRQETELLVAHIASILEKEDLEERTLWDVCTGSGCIGIALKKRFPQLQVALSDVCSEALQVARENAQDNQVDVDILQGDLLAPFSGQKAHYFVCNPPYISEEEFVTLEPEVSVFEPKRALVAKKSGLAFYERLAKELPNHLVSGGKAWFEMGSAQKEAVEALFPTKKKCTFSDFAGHPRFFSLEIE